MVVTSLLGLHAVRACSAIVKGGLTRCVPQFRPVSRLMVKSYATVSSTPTATKTPRKPRTTSSSTTKKAAAPKKKSVAAPKKKKAPAPKKKVVKLKSWEARDASGKLVPLPSATKPKVTTQAYLIYLHSRMPVIKGKPEMLKEGTDKIDVTKITKALAAEWNALSAAEKKPFQDQAAEGQKEYDSKIAVWRDSLTAEDIRRENAYLRARKKDKKIAKVTLLRDPKKPKLPRNAFLFYMAEFRSQSHGDKKLTDLAREGGSNWKSMSESDKQPYISQAEQETAEYRKKMEAYRADQS